MATSNKELFEEEDVRLVDIADSIGGYLKYLLKKFYIVIIGVGGMTYLLYLYAKKAPPEYVAFTSFNTVDPKGIAASGLISLASSLGMGASGTQVDLLAGLYQSRLIFYNALLKDVEVDGKVDKLGNQFMRVYNLDAGFKQIKGKENFGFTAENIDDFSNDEDSIARTMYTLFAEELLEAEYEVTSGLIFSEITTPNYELSRNLGIHIIEGVTDYYQEQQIESAQISYKTIDKKLDSLKGEIDFREKKLAQMQDQNIFNIKRQGVYDQDEYRSDLQILKIAYNEALNTKEAAKSSSKPQASPVRVVDNPRFATYPKYKSTLFFGLIGFAIGIVLVVIPLLIRKAIKDGKLENELKEKAKANTNTVS
jgi:hypothetical protein